MGLKSEKFPLHGSWVFFSLLKGTDALNGIFHLQPDNSWGTRKALPSERGKPQTSSTFSRHQHHQRNQLAETRGTGLRTCPNAHRNISTKYPKPPQYQPPPPLAPSTSPPKPSGTQTAELPPPLRSHPFPKSSPSPSCFPHHHATQDLMPPNPTYHHQRARPHSRKKIPTCPATRAASFHPPPPQLHNAPHCTRTAPRIYRESGVR